MPNPVVIIGGGLAGLTCARTLDAQSVDFELLEASDAVGGRVRTDERDGFLLDRGFQVLLTAYPEAERQLDYDSLNLCTFEPGSLVRTESGFHRLSDPWRQPQYALQTALTPVGSLADKLRIGRLRWSAGRGTVDGAFERPDRTTDDELRRLGFSDGMIDQFFRPFLGGVFLDPKLETSCRMLYFVFRMFSHGETTLPARGMGEIPRQLCSQLPEDSVRLNAPVESIESTRVTLRSGEEIPCSSVVLATTQATAARLVPQLQAAGSPRSVHCVYFAAAEPPNEEKLLILNGCGYGPVNNLCVPSQIAPEYAPDGESLISASVLNADVDGSVLHQSVRKHMRHWFGNVVNSWRHLRTCHIPDALPNQSTPAFEPPLKAAKVRENLYVCGDYRANGSINGAMQSGRLAAEQLISEI